MEEGFWIDKIKSHCYVTVRFIFVLFNFPPIVSKYFTFEHPCVFLAQYSTTEESMATREALHGVKWPTSNPKVLRVDFCDQDEV